MTGRGAGRSAARAADSGPPIVWSSPLPPVRSGVSDYAVELIPHLARHLPVSVVAPPQWTPDPATLAVLDAALPHLGAEVPTPEGATELLHLGNNPYHLWIARRLRRFGGIVVLHDAVLHHLLVEEAAADDAWSRFASDLEAAHGQEGAAIATARRWGFHGRLDPFLLPARAALLRHAGGVIVHNLEALTAVQRDCPGLPVRRVPLAVARLAAEGVEGWRARLAGDDELLVAHLGFLTPAKGLETIVRALAVATRLGVKIRLLIVGEGSEEGGLMQLARASGVHDRITLWGYADSADLGGILSAVDLGIATRYPTAGETSAAVLRFLALGTPVAVSGYAQFLEWPEAAAPRLAVGRRGVVDLVRLWMRMHADVTLRVEMRQAARQAWERGEHDPERAAARFAVAVAELAACS